MTSNLLKVIKIRAYYEESQKDLLKFSNQNARWNSTEPTVKPHTGYKKLNFISQSLRNRILRLQQIVL